MALASSESGEWRRIESSAAEWRKKSSGGGKPGGSNVAAKIGEANVKSRNQCNLEAAISALEEKAENSCQRRSGGLAVSFGAVAAISKKRGGNERERSGVMRNGRNLAAAIWPMAFSVG